MTTTRCWPSIPSWKEFRVDTKNMALCTLGKTQKNKSSHGQMFSGKDFYEPKFLHLLIAKEILMSWISVWTWFSWLAPQQLSYSCSSLGRISLTFLLSLFLQVAVRQEYPLANTQTMLEQAALSFCGLSASSAKAPWGPQSILHLISYTGDHPQWWSHWRPPKPQGRPPTTSWAGDVLTPQDPGKVFCHITWETLERYPPPWAFEFIPICQEMSYRLKIA